MKNLILGSVFVAAAVTSLSANAAGAQTFCNAGSAGPALVAATASDTDFVKVQFTPKCSTNVFLVGNDRNPLLYTVGSASIKGKNKFGGSSAGGSVSVIGNGCASSACVLQDATDGSDGAPSS
ncbi:MAG: hypothetical protein IAE88_15315 [Rhodobacteraceae bacterium]|nr:hypothetical protein [Paracoccaceae bacterium]